MNKMQYYGELEIEINRLLYRVELLIKEVRRMKNELIAFQFNSLPDEELDKE